MSASPTGAVENLAARLRRFLGANLEGALEIRIDNLAPITAGNARQAWEFDVRWLERSEERKVRCVMLRKAEAGQLETDLVPEFRIISALWDSGVPVARALWMDSEGRWLERPAFIMEKVAGVTDLPALLKPESAGSSRAIAQQLAAIAARLHTVDWSKLGVDFLPATTPETAAARQISYWESLFLKHRMEPHPVMTAAFIWLKEHPPVAGRISIVHGDFRFGNFLYEGDRINAMLDWEMVHLGDPVEDLAWAYRSLWGPQAFFPLDEFVVRYTELSGIPVPYETLRFYRLLGEVKHSIISLTGARSFMDGRTRNLFLADRASTTTGYLMQFLDWLPE
ncbi:MAG TPA: phosphotransferase family protein [Candidatus Binataceae bacterium]|nr:phosphotransferase family protein [Candidatus Binataceae bacterium]